MDARTSRYHDEYERWRRDPDGFWAEAARDIDWYEPPKRVFDPNAGVYGRWFPDAVCNTCWNAVDRHVMRGRGAQPAIIYDSPLAGTKRILTYDLLLTEVQVLAALLRDFGVEKGDRVVLYMPMVPEAVIGMLACARIGAVHSVVFGGFAARELATRIDDAKPKVILSASCGLEPGRIVKYKPLLDEAIALVVAQARRLPDPAAPAGAGGADRRPRPRLEGAARQRHRVREIGVGLRAARRHRSALHPLHLGHHRPAEGRGARQWRPHGRAQLVDEEPLRHAPGRGVLGGLRRRLGGRPQLHRLCAADLRLLVDPLRRQAGRHARRRRVLARDLRAPLRGAVHRADRVPRHQEGGPAGQVHRAIRSQEFPRAVPGRRARRSRHRDLGAESARQAGDRSLVADRDRLGDRRQSARPRPAAGEARHRRRADAGLRPARGRRAVQGGAARTPWARWW